MSNPPVMIDTSVLIEWERTVASQHDDLGAQVVIAAMTLAELNLGVLQATTDRIHQRRLATYMVASATL